jgi:3-keto-disaccharide hydrolase
MRKLKTFLCVAVTTLLVPYLRADEPKAFKFSKADLGKAPADWTVTQTGKGQGSVWKIVEDSTAPSKTGLALAQTAESPSAVFNVCVAKDTSYQDVEVSVAFKAVKGVKDQGGGIVWRYQDADNYYVARFNPLEDNYRLYKVIAGKRIQLETKEDIKVPTGEWHVLKIKHVGDQIECYLDGKKILEGKDNTIAKAGQVGLWSKADAQTYFDTFMVIAAKN